MTWKGKKGQGTSGCLICEIYASLTGNINLLSWQSICCFSYSSRSFIDSFRPQSHLTYTDLVREGWLESKWVRLCSYLQDSLIEEETPRASPLDSLSIGTLAAVKEGRWKMEDGSDSLTSDICTDTYHTYFITKYITIFTYIPRICKPNHAQGWAEEVHKYHVGSEINTSTRSHRTLPFGHPPKYKPLVNLNWRNMDIDDWFDVTLGDQPLQHLTPS